MDHNSKQEKEDLTRRADSSTNIITDGEPESDATGESEPTMSRRALLVATGVATATVAGCLGDGSTDSVQLQSLGVYGYGGSQVMASTAKTVSVEETEPNDTREEAMAVSLGTEIQATLETAGVDWFAFDAESDQTVIAELVRSADEGVSSVILYGPGGDYQNLVFVGTNDPVSVVETVETTGTHYVEVVDIEQGDGDYSLAITTDAGSTTSTPTQTSTPEATATPTATDTPTPTPTATPYSEDEYGEQSYGEYGYGGVDA